MPPRVCQAPTSKKPCFACKFRFLYLNNTFKFLFLLSDNTFKFLFLLSDNTFLNIMKKTAIPNAENVTLQNAIPRTYTHARIK